MAMRLIGRRIGSSFLGRSSSAAGGFNVAAPPFLAPPGARHFQMLWITRPPPYSAGLLCRELLEWALVVGTIGGTLYWMDFRGYRSEIAEVKEFEAEIERIMMGDKAKEKGGD